jgi:predicted nucleic acid-binding protein
MPVSADPDDGAFLACALAAGAEIVVSDGQHLRRVSGWNGIKVLTPRQFSDQFLVPGTP